MTAQSQPIHDAEQAPLTAGRAHCSVRKEFHAVWLWKPIVITNRKALWHAVELSGRTRPAAHQG